MIYRVTLILKTETYLEVVAENNKEAKELACYTANDPEIGLFCFEATANVGSSINGVYSAMVYLKRVDEYDDIEAFTEEEAIELAKERSRVEYLGDSSLSIEVRKVVKSKLKKDRSKWDDFIDGKPAELFSKRCAEGKDWSCMISKNGDGVYHLCESKPEEDECRKSNLSSVELVDYAIDLDDGKYSFYDYLEEEQKSRICRALKLEYPSDSDFGYKPGTVIYNTICAGIFCNDSKLLDYAKMRIIEKQSPDPVEKRDSNQIEKIRKHLLRIGYVEVKEGHFRDNIHSVHSSISITSDSLTIIMRGRTCGARKTVPLSKSRDVKKAIGDYDEPLESK